MYCKVFEGIFTQLFIVFVALLFKIGIYTALIVFFVPGICGKIEMSLKAKLLI